MFSRHFLVLATLVALASVGCRTQGSGVIDPVEKKDGDAGGGDDDEGEGGGPKTGLEKVGIGEGGPKVMGYQYFVRASYGMLRGKYSDEQDNETVGRTSEIPEVNLTGKRVTIEHYPVVWQNYPRSHYGYALIDYRSETTNTVWWAQHDTIVLLMGYILPKWRLLAPVVGLHWEFNKIDMGLPESPEVSKSDLRAVVVGADTRQKIWGTGTWLAFFYHAKAHLLNPSMASHGYEADAGLGTSLQLSVVRAEVTVGAIKQTYNGSRKASADDERLLKVTSQYQAAYLQVTAWM